MKTEDDEKRTSKRPSPLLCYLGCCKIADALLSFMPPQATQGRRRCNSSPSLPKPRHQTGQKKKATASQNMKETGKKEERKKRRRRRNRSGKKKEEERRKSQRNKRKKETEEERKKREEKSKKKEKEITKLSLGAKIKLLGAKRKKKKNKKVKLIFLIGPPNPKAQILAQASLGPILKGPPTTAPKPNRS
jgi:hypothetical protein